LGQEFDHAVPGLQVKDVEFVDPRRDDEQRNLMDGPTLRSVLDEFDELVAVNYLASRDGEVATRLESRRINHRELALLQIANQVSPSIRQAGTSRLQRASQGDWIGSKAVSRAHRIHKLPQVKSKPVPFGRSHRLSFSRQT
jgi:hypothetical protein